MRPAPLARLFVLLALSLGVLGGCRSGSALHNRYNNFRAYYNTYYNASRSLEDGERALEQAAVTVDRSRLVPVFPVTESAGGTSGPFQEAIDKSAELLRTRPGSKWADDALLVIGKAYFYQRNLAGAEQKFRETMAAAELADDRRLGDEARFWLGRTYAAGDRFDEGVLALEEGLADPGGDRRWTARMRLALGELYARAGRWDEAAETLRAGAPDEDDADVAARAYVLLGQVEEHAERWDFAADAYRAALDRNPAYELGYAAQLGRAMVLGVDAGQTDAALDAVRRMRADDKNYPRRAELALAEAQLREAAGDDGAALGLFRQVLYDDELAAGAPVKGQAHYRLGEFYRDALGDYVRASAHFDTAATALRAPAADVRAARGAILDVSDEARTYAVLAGAARRIAETDSLLALGALDDDAFRTRIAQIEGERRRVFVEEQRRLDEARTAQRFTGEGGTVFTGDQGQDRSRQPSAPAPAGESAGFLSYRVPASIQAGRIAFEQRWGTRPLVPSWRRRAAVQAGDLASTRAVVSDQVPGGLGLGEGPPPLDLSQVPRTPAKREELVTELAGLRYELANAFFLSLGRADTAATLYRTILDDAPGSPVGVRARYALAEIERAAGRESAAQALYQAVAEADTAALGRASRVRLGLATDEVGAGPVETSAAYDAARARWRSGDPLGGALDLVALADADPDAPTAPRAYLAAAAAYVDWVGADTLALARPLPDSLVSPVLLAAANEIAGASDPSAPEPSAAEPPAGRDEADALPGDALPADAPPADERPVLLDEPRPAGEPVRLDDEPARPPRGLLADDDEAVDQRRAARRAARQTAPASPAPAPRPDVGPLAPADTASFTLRHHLAAVASRYSGTPYADRARALAAALPVPEDSTATPGLPADSTQTPSPDDVPGVPADSALAVAGSVDGPAAEPDEAPVAVEVDESGAGPIGLRGEAPLDPSAGGFAWRVQRVTLAAEAGPLVEVLAGAGFRAATLFGDDGDVVVAIGQFETAAEAEAARDSLPAWAQIRGEVISLDGFRTAPPDRPKDDF